MAGGYFRAAPLENMAVTAGVHLTLSGMALLLGVIPNQSRCRWAFVPISRHDTRALAVLNKGYVYCDPEV